MKGIFTLLVIEELSRYLSRPLVSYFDLIVATSTGAYIAAQLLSGKSLASITARYEGFRSELQERVGGPCRYFTNMLCGWRSLPARLTQCRLRREFGDTELSSLNLKFAIVSATGDTSPVEPFLLRSYTLPRESLLRAPPGATGGTLWEVLQASTAAPVLCDPVPLHGRLLLDGAVVGNNPSVIALSEAGALLASRSGRGTGVDLLLSLGTGLTVPKPHTASHVFQWFSMAAKMLINTHVAHTVTSGLLDAEQYIRIDPEGVGHLRGIEWRPEELEKGKARVREWLALNNRLIRDTCVRLEAGSRCTVDIN